MAQRSEPSAAQALFGHLPSAVRAEVQQRHKPTTAQAMYPTMPSLAPKPERRWSQGELREAWRDHVMQLMGLRRKKD